MSDDPRIAKPTITTTLRHDWHSVDACKPPRNPMAELRSENDALRAENERLRRENEGLRGGHVDFPTCDPDTVLRMPVSKFRLTDAEREALKSAIWDYEQNDDDDGCASMVATLRGLLERLK